MTAKVEILDLIQGFPDVPTFDEAISRLWTLYEQPKLDRPGRAETGAPGASFVLKKDQILELMQRLPDQLTDHEAIDEAAYRLYVLFMIELGLEESRNGEGIPHEEAMRRFAKWRG